MRRVMCLIGLLLLAGCNRGPSKAPASHLSEAQRDTALSRSGLPGASAVGRAFEAADQAAGHAAQLDTLPK